MAFVFVHGEPVGEAIQRILIELIDKAIAQLADPKRKPATRVHDVRKRFKEVRAVLRLIRKPLGETFVVENMWFRSAGRDLGILRDAEALVEATIVLRTNARSIGDKRLLTRVRRTLQRRSDEAAGADLDARLANLAGQLPIAKARLANLPVMEDRFGTIGAGLQRVYALGRRGFLRSSIAPSTAEVHEWRKRVKDHWYHVQLLGDIWPDLMKPYAEVMSVLSHTLGDLHDLDVLHDLAMMQPSLFGSPRSAHRLLNIISSRRAALLNSAIDSGGRVYAEQPAAWRQRVRGYWRSWRG